MPICSIAKLAATVPQIAASFNLFPPALDVALTIPTDNPPRKALPPPVGSTTISLCSSTTLDLWNAGNHLSWTGMSGCAIKHPHLPHRTTTHPVLPGPMPDFRNLSL